MLKQDESEVNDIKQDESDVNKQIARVNLKRRECEKTFRKSICEDRRPKVSNTRELDVFGIFNGQHLLGLNTNQLKHQQDLLVRRWKFE